MSAFEMTPADAMELLRWGEDAHKYGTWLGGRSTELWNRLYVWHGGLLVAENLRGSGLASPVDPNVVPWEARKNSASSVHPGCDDADCLHWGYETYPGRRGIGEID